MALRRARGRADRLRLHLRLRDRYLGLLRDSLELSLGRCDGLRLRDGDGLVACGCGAVCCLVSRYAWKRAEGTYACDSVSTLV
jgi:hypothetical protein